MGKSGAMPIAATRNLRECFDSVRDLLREIGDDEWDAPSLCPGWDVHSVVAHLTGIETVLSGWRPNPDPPGLFERLVPFMEEARGWSSNELLDRFEAVTAARRAELAEMDPDDFEAPCWTPVGQQTYGRFIAVRVFDFWVHEQDIRVPLGRQGHLEGAAAQMALDEVRASFGYIAGKKVAVPDGRSVSVHLTGPLVADLSAAVVNGRAVVDAPTAPRVPDASSAPRVPDASIMTDSLTFMLLACGRIDPAAALADGRVTRAGEPELATRLATGLRFTF